MNKIIIAIMMILSLAGCSKVLDNKTLICRDPKVTCILGIDYVAVNDCYLTEKN